jgi:non-ribosomal peptide synthetase component E (peptide arylation enzyme)
MPDHAPSLRIIFTVGDTAGRVVDAVAIEDLEARDATQDERSQLDRIAATTDLDAPAVLQLSGGTTGTPKVIPRLHTEYWYNARATAEWWRMGPDDRLAFALPISHNAGVVNALFAAHAAGAALLLSTPQADQLLPLMTRHGATWLMSPPGIMRDYQADPRFDRAVSSLRNCVLTAAPVTRALFDGLQARGVHVTQAFGMSEGLFLFTPSDGSDELRARTVGLPISPYDEVRLLTPGTEEQVPDGEVGELCVHGPYTIRGYLDEPQRNAVAFTADGFYRSGDLAMRLRIGDEVGYVLSGRTKDLINRGGEKINAEEIETLLVQHPDIVDAALVAMPDERLGERSCVFVVVGNDAAHPTVATLAAFLGARGVAKYKWPERVEIVGALPRTNIGKVNKLTLRGMAAETTS